MFIAFILVFSGIFLLVKKLISKSKESQKDQKKVLSEGEILKNSYIIRHEKKIKDDKEYEEYLEWCKIKGELASDKEGFDEYRMREYLMYKKLIKFGFKNVRK